MPICLDVNKEKKFIKRLHSPVVS